MRKYFVMFLLVVSAISYAQTATQNAFYKSYEHEKNGKYTQAIQELKTVYTPGDYFINIRLGWLYYLAKQNNESLKFYNMAIQLKPTSIEAKFGSVKPLSAMENWEKVKLQYQSILKIDPRNTVAAYWLGVIHYNRKEFQSADRLFQMVVNLYPLDYDSVIMLAWTKLNLGKKVEAKTLFNHALTLRPKDESALNGLQKIK